MKKVTVISMGLCMALALTACKSSESAYKKAYEKAKQQELVGQDYAVATQVTPVQETPSISQQQQPVAAPGSYREEQVTLVSGTQLEKFSVVIGSFGVKVNAESLKERMVGEGYNARVVYNAERNMYRVIVASYGNYEEATREKEAFKQSHTNNADFQKAWLLYAK